MISDLLVPSPDQGRDALPLLFHEDSTVTWGALRAEALRLEHTYADCLAQRVALSFSASLGGLAAIAALDRLGCDVVLLDARFSADMARDIVAPLEVASILHSTDPEGHASWGLLRGQADAQHATGTRQVTILTSGTTGTPKAVCHTWDSLLRPVRRGLAKPTQSAWLMSYRAHLYAGLQVILQAIACGDALAVPRPSASPTDIAQLMVDSQVGFASATPAYWRQLLVFAPRPLMSRIPLRQITLGGEVVDQLILDQLRDLFPDAQVSHIYATTELGRCFSVRDGLAGFPQHFLHVPSSDGVRLRIVDGELQVQSANAMLGYYARGSIARGNEEHGWNATGDLVEVVGDRVYFVGRRSEMINVGGNKVLPSAVESVIRRVAGVNDVRVYGKPSSLAGEIVACHVVTAAGADRDALRQRIARECRAHLASPQVPRWIEFVDRIELAPSGKVLRKLS